MKVKEPSRAPIHAVILAAGQGTRMKSALPKVLHPVGGVPMLGRVLAAANAAGVDHSHLVLGHGADKVWTWLDSLTILTTGEPPKCVMQEKQLGTAHAVSQAMPGIPDAAIVVVLYGDVPLVSAATIKALIAAAGGGLALVTVEVAQPKGYGRIVRSASGGRITAIVEENDATQAQRAINEINTGLLAAPARRLKRWLSHVKNQNAKGEFYLTDVVAMAASDGVEIARVTPASIDEVEGVNDPVQLAQAERRFQRAQVERLQREGLYLADPVRFDLRGDLQFGRDVFIDVGCVFEGSVQLGDGVRIGPYCLLRDVVLGAGTRVEAHSVLDTATVGENCKVGPFARLRPGAELGNEVRIGNFVEIKKSVLGEGTQANHLAYVGDATVGARVNIGAGVITCNYDGVDKHQTVIGDDAFIGTDSQLVAPVSVGRGAYIAAGSTITKDAPDDALTINRAHDQKSFPGWKPANRK